MEPSLSNSSQYSMKTEDYFNVKHQSEGIEGAGDSVNTNPNNMDDMLGSASDYILIAMIVAMMFCMTICCLCLFCRSSSHFSICGFNFEMNNSATPVAPDDLSELHEVLPLTPTPTGEVCRLPDIENMLRSDPPPPPYVDVAQSSSVRDKFRWRSKRKGTLTNEQKPARDTPRLKKDEALNEAKRSSSSVGRIRPRFSFQRSLSHQSSRNARMRANSSLPAQMSSTGEDQPKSAARKPSILASLRIRSPHLPTSASESSVGVSLKSASAHEPERKPSVSSAKSAGGETLDPAGDPDVKFDLTDSSCTPENSNARTEEDNSQSVKVSCDDDDEVFM